MCVWVCVEGAVTRLWVCVGGGGGCTTVCVWVCVEGEVTRLWVGRRVELIFLLGFLA